MFKRILDKKYFFILIITAVFFVFTGCEKKEMKTENTTDFDKLNWMMGVWEGKQGDASLYESWTKQNYRTIEGISFTTQDKVRIYSQNMHLEQSNNKIFLLITPKENKEVTTLNLETISDSLAEFINQDSTGYPKKIIYTMIASKRMEVKVDGETPETSTILKYRKTKDY